jgi:hypothetical protein
MLMTPAVVEFIGLSGQQWTTGGLLAMVVLSILFGVLYPRSHVKEIKDDRDEWRRIAITLLDTNGVLAEGVKETSVPAKAVAETVMTAAQQIIGGRQRNVQENEG